MKKIYLILFVALLTTNAKSLSITNATIAIGIGPGTVYNPSVTTAQVGDKIVFAGSSSHPTTQVDQNTWNTNGTTPLSGGWGTQTVSFSFTLTAAQTGTIFYVCNAHVGNTNPMKGKIIVNNPTGLSNFNNQLTQISLFPNPANSEVNVTIPANLSDVTLKLIGVNGQQIALTTSNSQISSNSANTVLTAILPNSIGNGVYFIEVSTANERIYKKVVITK